MINGVVLTEDRQFPVCRPSGNYPETAIWENSSCEVVKGLAIVGPDSLERFDPLPLRLPIP